MIETRALLVVDEAQWLNRECIEYLRHLHDQPYTRFALLLVGGDGCWEVLLREPMLRSRDDHLAVGVVQAVEAACERGVVVAVEGYSHERSHHRPLAHRPRAPHLRSDHHRPAPNDLALPTHPAHRHPVTKR